MFASGKHSVGICMRSGRKMRLRDMVPDGQYPWLMVSPEWREERHPQEKIRPLRDPVALRHPAPLSLPAPLAPVLTGGSVGGAASRAAAAGVGGIPGTSMPFPDGSVGEADRAQLAGVAVGAEYQLSWTEATAPATQIARYDIYRSDDGGSTYAVVATVIVERDTFGGISNSPYSYTGAEIVGGSSYYVQAEGVQGPPAASNVISL